MSVRAAFAIVRDTDAYLLIRDEDLGGRSVTNDAEAVVAYLLKEGRIWPGKALFYFDSDGEPGELVFDKRGFRDFAPAAPLFTCSICGAALFDLADLAELQGPTGEIVCTTCAPTNEEDPR